MYIKDKDGNYVPTPSSKGADGREVNLRVANNYIQWRYPDTEWTNLVSLASLKGNPGTDGVDGREVHMRVVSDAIQWRLGDSGTWQTLMSLTSVMDGASFGGMVVDKTLVLAEAEDSNLSKIETRHTIAAGELETLTWSQVEYIRYALYTGTEITADMGLPDGIEHTFVLINGPTYSVETGNEYSEYEHPQTLFDGKAVYVRRMSVSVSGMGSEDDPEVYTYGNKNWTKIGTSNKWERVTTIPLTQSTNTYILADLSQYQKVIVQLARATYVQGLNKNVWLRVATDTTSEFYTVGYMTAEYGYQTWWATVECNDLFITGTLQASNNANSESTARANIIKPFDTQNTRATAKLKLTFTDTSVIQSGDSITVWGLKE